MMSSSNNDIHGHEVMRMMLEAGETYDEASLEKAIHTRFGELVVIEIQQSFILDKEVVCKVFIMT